MRLNLLVATAALSLTRCSFDATGLSAESSGVSSTTTGDESTGPAPTTTLDPTTDDPTGTPASCGNSQLDIGEECDNGELNNGNNGSICKAGCIKNVCGDSYVASNEGCDDGNSIDGDECSNACKLTGCGDGVPGPGEECDDDNTVDDDACSNLCKLPFCGDGNIGGAETCDDGAINGDDQACKLDCKLAMCSDGKVLIGVEACDDGNQVDDDGCANDCKLTSCDDGIQQMGEECDDGDKVETNECTNLCKNPICGDSIVTPTMEECDLGIMNNDNAECTANCTTATCGDNLLLQNSMEECDDGIMNNDNDACTANCKTATCGDSLLQTGVEDCDDGNNNNDDGCAMCKKTCGNGMPNPGEECDDGNANADFCDTFCKKAAYRVFVTGKPFDGNLGGTSGANELCTTAAKTAMPPIAGNYKAWLSDDNDEPLDSFHKSTLPYRRRDGMTVADNWNDLVTGSLLVPISHTENGVLGGGPLNCSNLDALVWTNTKGDGSKDSEPHCSNWSSNMNQAKGGLGHALQISSAWTGGCEMDCNTMARLYCFEQP